ncbi:MAG: chromosomal replication initiator protein DnaA [Kiritimatiellae bacterium]|nr:chromosomal replication initiator protein DnaA [Kiritimatiellia bacterium]
MNNTELDGFWQLACFEIKAKVGDDVFQRHIEPLKLLGLSDNGIVSIETDNNFSKNFVSNNYLGIIEDALHRALGNQFSTVELSVAATQERLPEVPIFVEETIPQQSSVSSQPQESKELGFPLNENYCFKDFIVGPSNSFAAAAARAVSDNPGCSYNPLFIYGDTGLGKTHLMQAIGHEALKKNPKFVVCYTTTEALLNDFVESIQKGQVGSMSFRQRYRSVDILLIDDIHFMAGKTALQEEFFNMFNDLTARKKQIVMTSDRPPQEIHSLEERLVSRFQAGLITSVESPAFETRLAIIRYKVSNSNLRVPISDQILQFIAENVKSNVRQLEGALKRVTIFAESFTIGTEPTLDDVRNLIKDMLEEEIQPDLSFSHIQKVVAEFFNITVADIMSKERSQNIALPRQMAMFLCRKLTKGSLPEISRSFDKTHATVLHGCKTIMNRMEQDAIVKRQVESIAQSLGRSPDELYLAVD